VICAKVKFRTCLLRVLLCEKFEFIIDEGNVRASTKINFHLVSREFYAEYTMKIHEMQQQGKFLNPELLK